MTLKQIGQNNLLVVIKQMSFLGFILVLSLSAHARSKSPGFRGGFSAPSMGINASYLSNQNYGLDTRSSDQSALKSGSLLDDQAADEIQIRYENYAREYYAKEQRGLNTLNDDRIHQDRVQEVAKDLIKAAQRKQARLSSKGIKKTLSKDENLKTPATVVAGGVALLYGAPIRMKVSEDTRVQARAFGLSQRAELALSCPWVEGRFDVAAQDPNAKHSISQDATQAFDRYRLSFWKGIPVLDLSTGLSYGFSSNTVTTSLSRPVIQNLVAVVDSTRSFDSSSPVVQQETVKLLYNFRF